LLIEISYLNISFIVKESILKDDTPLNLIDPELYSEYSKMQFTKRGIDIQYWLENVVSKHEAKRIQTFGKLDGNF